MSDLRQKLIDAAIVFVERVSTCHYCGCSVEPSFATPHCGDGCWASCDSVQDDSVGDTPWCSGDCEYDVNAAYRQMCEAVLAIQIEEQNESNNTQRQ